MFGCLDQIGLLAFYMYVLWYSLNNFIWIQYYVSCSLQGVFVFEDLGNREDLLQNISRDMKACQDWRSDIADRWGQFDFNRSHRLCVVDYSSHDKAMEVLTHNCSIGQWDGSIGEGGDGGDSGGSWWN